MPNLTDKFAADYAAKWEHTKRDWACVGHDTSHNDFNGTDVEDNDDD